MAGGKNDLFVKLFSSRRHARNVCHHYYILNLCVGGSKRRSYMFGGEVAIEKNIGVVGEEKLE